MTSLRPHRLNVVGDFYVTSGCCTACGVPQASAPGLFSYDADDHCYVSRQPMNADELDAVLSAMATQDLGCIRYRGSDAAVIAKLRKLGEGDQVDVTAKAVPASPETQRISGSPCVEWPLFSWIAKLIRRITQR